MCSHQTQALQPIWGPLPGTQEGKPPGTWQVSGFTFCVSAPQAMAVRVRALGTQSLHGLPVALAGAVHVRPRV